LLLLCVVDVFSCQSYAAVADTARPAAAVAAHACSG
jgi:hypothetical protein